MIILLFGFQILEKGYREVGTRKKVEKTIVANPHSLSETVQYAKDKYELTETAPADREYIEQIKCLKESLILQYKPELLGEMKDIPVPDFSNEASVKEYLGKIKFRHCEQNTNGNKTNFYFHLVSISFFLFRYIYIFI